MNPAITLVRSDAESVLEGRSHTLAALRGQHIFITGGTGFLGAWLLELIAVLNDRFDFKAEVTALSRSANEFASRWPHLAAHPWLNFQDGDIRYFTEFPKNIHYIIHAAALTDRRLLASQPGAVAEINSAGTFRILKAASLLEDVKKIVLMSSGLVYGAQSWDDVQKTTEDSFGPLPCNNVNAVYAESKRFAEIIAQCASSESKLPITTLRPFAFLGPYQSLQLPWAVTDFIRDSMNGGPIRIMGDGSTMRSLMYGSDFAFWTLSALANAPARTVYNVGSSDPIDLSSLAKMIAQFFLPLPEIRTGLGQAGHARNRLVPCTRRAKADLGLELTVPLSEAIRRTITWHRMNPSN